MMDKKERRQYSETLKELFGLEYSPVALSRVKGAPPSAPEKKSRICRAILDAGKGETLEIGKANNACFGASWHLGFHQIKDAKTIAMVKKFVVEGEKLFCSHEALENLMSQMEPPPDHGDTYFVLSPLEKAEIQPELVIFIVDAEAACRLLTLVTFLDGNMPKLKIGGPTCRLSIVYPLLSGEVNISFYDYTARRMCNVEKDKLLVTIPYSRIPDIVGSIEKCSAGKAKIEFPAEFREFLQARLNAKPS
jgi:uncharacterized protein (DUF169 family)